jgi:hypothetical protein
MPKHKAKKKKSFPDLSGDGKTTMKDILIGRGVIKRSKGGSTMPGMKKRVMKRGGGMAKKKRVKKAMGGAMKKRVMKRGGGMMKKRVMKRGGGMMKKPMMKRGGMAKKK